MVKKKSSIKYVSKGERQNVNEKLLKSIRRDKKKSIEDLLKAHFHRVRVIDKPQNKEESKLRARYIEENDVAAKSQRLMNTFSECGLTRAEAVFAIKTQREKELTKKWKVRLSVYRKAEQQRKEEFSKRMVSSGRIR